MQHGMQHDHIQKQKNIWPFDPNPGVKGMCKNSGILAFMVVCAQFPFFWYATSLLSEKDIVWHFVPLPGVEGVSVGKKFATMLLHVLLALFDMQHDHIPKKIGLGPHP